MRPPSDEDGPGSFASAVFFASTGVLLPAGRTYDVRGVIILDFICDMMATATTMTKPVDTAHIIAIAIK